MREAHLSALSFVLRFGEGLVFIFLRRDIAGVLMEIARILRASAVVQHFARIGPAFRPLRGAVEERTSVVHHWSAAACRSDIHRHRASCPSESLSARKRRPADRSCPRPGMRGMIFPILTSQPRNLPIPRPYQHRPSFTVGPHSAVTDTMDSNRARPSCQFPPRGCFPLALI